MKAALVLIALSVSAVIVRQDISVQADADMGPHGPVRVG